MIFLTILIYMEAAHTHSACIWKSTWISMIIIIDPLVDTNLSLQVDRCIVFFTNLFHKIVRSHTACNKSESTHLERVHFTQIIDEVYLAIFPLPECHL